jgi:hypothetical protein
MKAAAAGGGGENLTRSRHGWIRKQAGPCRRSRPVCCCRSGACDSSRRIIRIMGACSADDSKRRACACSLASSVLLQY